MEFWNQRTTKRRKCWLEPGDIWDDCVEYFETTSQRTVDGKRVPFTKKGLLVFLGTTHKTWNEYSTSKEFERFHEVCEHVENIIYTQKFEGATIGSFNPSIIIRDLGLHDEIKQTGDHSVKIEIDANTIKDIRDKLQNDV